MSFVKAAFWIGLILLLMPGDAQERYDLYSTAQRTIADIGGFCGRNPDVCAKTSEAASGIVRKLKNTTDTIEDMLRETGLGAQRPRLDERDYYDRERHGALHQHSDVKTTSSLSSDTLTAEDRRPAWRGPGTS
jgi:Family of unknown function (DUF5330)